MTRHLYLAVAVEVQTASHVHALNPVPVITAAMLLRGDALVRQAVSFLSTREQPQVTTQIQPFQAVNAVH